MVLGATANLLGWIICGWGPESAYRDSSPWPPIQLPGHFWKHPSVEYQVPSLLFKGVNDTVLYLTTPTPRPLPSAASFSRYYLLIPLRLCSGLCLACLGPFSAWRMALLKCPLFHENFSKFPREGSPLFPPLTGHTVVFLHKGRSCHTTQGLYLPFAFFFVVVVMPAPCGSFQARD